MGAAHELFIIKEEPDGSRAAIVDYTLTKLGRHGTDVTLGDSPKPLYDDGSFLQAMLDAAWEAGFRPKDFKDHTNEFTAVRYHLEDMRKLAKVDRS